MARESRVKGKMMADNDEIRTIKEAAEFVGCREETISKLMKQKFLSRVGDYFDREELEECAKKHLRRRSALSDAEHLRLQKQIKRLKLGLEGHLSRVSRELADLQREAREAMGMEVKKTE